MSLIDTKQVILVGLTQALASPLFPALDSTLCSSRHVGLGELDNRAFLMGFQEYFGKFYSRYNVGLICAQEGFFYLHPRSTALIPYSVLFELDMMVGKILCYLYLSLERLTSEGVSAQRELCDELLMLTDEAKLLKPVSNYSTGPDIDRQKLQEEVYSSLNHSRRLDMAWSLGHDNSRFHIAESVFRFNADVRSGDNLRETQRRLIRDGEATAAENHLQPSDEPEEGQPDSGEEE